MNFTKDPQEGLFFNIFIIGSPTNEGGREKNHISFLFEKKKIIIKEWEGIQDKKITKRFLYFNR